MTGSFSQQVQDELTHRCQPSPPPTLRAFLALFSANGLEVFAIVDGRGGDALTVQDRPVLTVYEDAPFAHAFHGAVVGDLVSFMGTTYMVAGHGTGGLPDLTACTSAFELDPAVRQAVGGMAARHACLSSFLRAQQGRLDEDRDTVQRAKRHHIYLFEQDRWVAPEFSELASLEGQLEALSQERGRRDIGRLGACYALELERLGALEEAMQGGTRRESGRQAPLRARRRASGRGSPAPEESRERAPPGTISQSCPSSKSKT